ncbi:hypothetical protein PIB30_050915 [Stylosanthes scabra]|uniref:Uncharacterized protein n=1 Tax=Stylosanthes scabra TaxID=79078 RepID=A0ABU6ZGJ2_9FABA|nr:hypothetical protein [Stylosanthes scabra]
MANQDEEGVVYTDHSGDYQRRDQQQQTLGLNATANEATGSGNANADSGGIQNGIGLSGPNPRHFGGIGSEESQIAQELRHRMQAMEMEVRELRKENAELRSTTRNPQSRRRTSPRRRSRTKSRSPPRRTQRPRTPPRRRRHHSSSDDRESSSGRDRNGRRRAYRRYKRTRDWTGTPPIDGHTPFSSRILRSTRSNVEPSLPLLPDWRVNGSPPCRRVASRAIPKQENCS